MKNNNNLYLCFVIIFFLVPASFSFAAVNQSVNSLNLIEKNLVLAEFNFSSANEALTDDDLPRAQDLLDEGKRHLKIAADLTEKLVAEKNSLLLREQLLALRLKRQELEKLAVSINKKLEANSMSGKSKLSFTVDSSYNAVDRRQGTIASDNNFENGINLKYLIGEKAELNIKGKTSSAQLLSSKTQSQNFELNYSTALFGQHKLNLDLALAPFIDNTTAANSNAETGLTVRFDQLLDERSRLSYKAFTKGKAWSNQPALDYSYRLLGINYRKNLTASKEVLLDGEYMLQDVQAGANAFSELKAAFVLNNSLNNNQKTSLSYKLNGRNYSNNSTPTYLKNELVASINLSQCNFDFSLVHNSGIGNSVNSYNGVELAASVPQSLSESTKYKVRGGILSRSFENGNGNYSRLSLQLDLDHALNINQSVKLSNLLEDALYATPNLSYLHNLLKLKYERRFPNDSILSLGERFTLDNYPGAGNQNAARHQLDLSYSWPTWPGSILYLGGGLELKAFVSPGPTQSDYTADNLFLNYDYAIIKGLKATLALNSFNKKNAQNPAADTGSRSVSFNVAYNY